MPKTNRRKAESPTRISTSRQVYAALREDILTLVLPPGEHIDEIGIAERYGVSRSPVREALIRLETDGLVRISPNRGAVVSSLHLEEFPAFIEALDLVQRVVTRLAAINRTDEDIAKIKALNKEFVSAISEHNVVRMIDKNHEFHMAIGAAAANRYFSHFYKRVLDDGRRILRLYFRSYNDHPPKDRVSTHSEIIKAIVDQDADRAEKLAQQHAQQLSVRFLDYLSKNRVAGIDIDVQA